MAEHSGVCTRMRTSRRFPHCSNCSALQPGAGDHFRAEGPNHQGAVHGLRICYCPSQVWVRLTPEGDWSALCDAWCHSHRRETDAHRGQLKCPNIKLSVGCSSETISQASASIVLLMLHFSGYSGLLPVKRLQIIV